MSHAAPVVPVAVPPPRLHGDLVVWLLILAELLTFGLLFASYSVARVLEPAVFAQSQALLDLRFGGVNTVLLVTGSACVAMAVHGLRQNARSRALGWWLAAAVCGLGFLSIKGFEYSAKFDEGVDLTTNTFWMFYLILTGFHFLHVLVGVVFIGILAVRTAQGAYGSHDVHAPESGAAFWHMVDLLWIVLFPLVYVLR